MTKITCFKAYDVRGRVPEDLDEDVAYRIGRAYADFLSPSKIVIGRDIRLTSPALSLALQRGLTDSGVDVIDIGIGGTELVYFATAHLELDGGVMVTASHNPPNYNGMKFVREKARPISEDTGLAEIRALAEKNDFAPADRSGNVETLDIMADYIDHLLGYVDRSALAPLKVVVNAGNGGAGPIIDRLEPHLPFEFIKVNHEPDGTFPNGVPNPMLEQNRASTAEPVVRLGADLGLAWDGDFDRCFFFDETGRFIEGYYIVGLLAQAFLEKSADERIVHDPRLTWNTLDIVGQMGGTTIQSKSGHAFIKETMRVSNAVYGGEMSAHHYFRDFSYADSGMIPWLLVAQIMSARACPLSQLVDERMATFPASGEINRKVADAAVALNTLENRYRDSAICIEHVDGLSMEFEDWRFNLRASNTEPLVRLNVESRGKPDLMEAKTEELLALVGGDPG
ncbi:MAG: phosphomannomutase [Gammaproteobacteria bacterium]|nr:phosphomannomutase [Gammaproteobacteria bacterium]MDH3506017.1 phosphomannomutase [Gammaproteobacteria bacterium]